jgi:DNA-binding XRE family transcriptional regulator
LLRREKRLTQEDAAKLIPSNRNTVHVLEHGSSDSGISELFAIKALLAIATSDEERDRIEELASRIPDLHAELVFKQLLDKYGDQFGIDQLRKNIEWLCDVTLLDPDTLSERLRSVQHSLRSKSGNI